MKILVLNGSPKKEKSDTMHITRAFLDGMMETMHHEIQMIHVIDRHIEFCSGCLACMRTRGGTVQADVPHGPHHHYSPGKSHVQCAGGGSRYRSEIGTCQRSRTGIRENRCN